MRRSKHRFFLALCLYPKTSSHLTNRIKNILRLPRHVSDGDSLLIAVQERGGPGAELRKALQDKCG